MKVIDLLQNDYNTDLALEEREIILKCMEAKLKTIQVFDYFDVANFSYVIYE